MNKSKQIKMNIRLKKGILNLSKSDNIEVALKEWYCVKEVDNKVLNRLCIRGRGGNKYPCICGYPVKSACVMYNKETDNLICVSDANKTCCIKYFRNKSPIIVEEVSKAGLRKGLYTIDRDKKIKDRLIVWKDVEVKINILYPLYARIYVDDVYNHEPYALRIYMDIPFNKKDECKKYGCKFDKNSFSDNKWYSVDSNSDKFNIDYCLSKWGENAYKQYLNKENETFNIIFVKKIPLDKRGYTDNYKKLKPDLIVKIKNIKIEIDEDLY